MKLLIDTNILIDQLRGLKPAILFAKALPEDTAISAITVVEIYAGARSEQQRLKATALIGTYKILVLDAGSAELAGDYMQRFSRSHALDLADAAIAATAKYHNRAFITLNLKHFPMFPGLKKPY